MSAKDQTGKVLAQLRSRWPEVRIAAIDALERAGVEGAALRDAAMREKNDVVLAAICEALMDCGDKDSIPVLKKLARTHASALVRRRLDRLRGHI